MLYSSAAATIGSEGQAAHSLACGYLDGLAEYARRNIKGLTVISIAWGHGKVLALWQKNNSMINYNTKV
ncbi:KR domain-containing protein [Escherichia coli]